MVARAQALIRSEVGSSTVHLVSGGAAWSGKLTVESGFVLLVSDESFLLRRPRGRCVIFAGRQSSFDPPFTLWLGRRESAVCRHWRFQLAHKPRPDS